MRRPTVAMALYGDPTNDGRVQREAASLAAAGYDVLVCALDIRDPDAIERVHGVRYMGYRPAISRVLPGTPSPFHADDPGTSRPVAGGRLGWVAGYLANLRAWGKWAVKTGGTPSVWHVNDLPGLLGLWIGGLPRHAPFVYDSHELYVESGSAARMPAIARGLLTRFERRLIRRAAGVLTVNRGIAQELANRYGVEPVVVLNCPSYVDVSRPGKLRSTLGLGDETIILYHGLVGANRGIETTIEALRRLPSSVVFVVLGDGSLVPYVRELREEPALRRRLYWHPSVPQSELLSWVVDADVGSVLIAPVELSFLLSTPNKLFECMTAGVPVVASDFPTMREIVLGEGIGYVCDPMDPLRVAEVIDRLLTDRAALRAMAERGQKAARRAYNWETQAAALVGLYGSVVAGQPVTWNDS